MPKKTNHPKRVEKYLKKAEFHLDKAFECHKMARLAISTILKLSKCLKEHKKKDKKTLKKVKE